MADVVGAKVRTMPTPPRYVGRKNNPQPCRAARACRAQLLLRSGRAPNLWEFNLIVLG